LQRCSELASDFLPIRATSEPRGRPDLCRKISTPSPQKSVPDRHGIGGNFPAFAGPIVFTHLMHRCAWDHERAKWLIARAMTGRPGPVSKWTPLCNPLNGRQKTCAPLGGSFWAPLVR